jgi:hypothetical protein
MADEEKRVARTAGVSGTFHVGDLTITPEGVEVTQDQWENEVAPAAAANHVVVRLDEDFRPRILQKQDQEQEQVPDDSATEAKTEETADASQGTAVDGQPPAPGTGTARRGAKSGG